MAAYFSGLLRSSRLAGHHLSGSDIPPAPYPGAPAHGLPVPQAEHCEEKRQEKRLH